MPEPTTVAQSFGDFHAYMAKARETVALDECAEHGGTSALHCQGCAAERLTQGAEARTEWARTAAMAKCDELFPRRFRDAEPDHNEVKGWLDAMREDVSTAPSLLLYGSTGTGKTYQAYAALRSALLVRPKIGWAASTFPDFAAALRPRQGVDTEAQMDRFRSVELLLMDDLGTAKGSEWVEEITYRLINGRYEDMKPTIFTTNLTLAELKLALGDRVAGRLAETCTQILLDGADWRRRAAV